MGTEGICQGQEPQYRHKWTQKYLMFYFNIFNHFCDFMDFGRSSQWEQQSLDPDPHSSESQHRKKCSEVFVLSLFDNVGEKTEFLFYAEGLRNLLPSVAGMYRYRHREHIVPGILSSRPNWLPQPPSPASECCPLWFQGKGGSTRLRERGRVEAIRTKGQKLWYSVV
jgi:hypothetical protein